MTEQQFNEITEWQKQTFAKADASSKLHHLRQEIDELNDDMILRSDNTRLEVADCMFLLFGAAAAYGMTYQDIVKAIDDKFEINKARNWGKPDENGVVNHIK